MQNLEHAENVLIHDNIFSQGYGIIAQKVMRQSSISRDARLFYAYLCSFAGSGDTAFPSTQTILTELGFSKKTFYKYRDELEAFGLITVETQNTRHGRQTIYRLPPVPVPTDEVMEIIEQRQATKNNRTANLPTIKSFPQSASEDSFPQSESFHKTAGQKPRFQDGTMGSQGTKTEPCACPQDGTMLNIDKSINIKVSNNLSEEFSTEHSEEVIDTQDKPADADRSNEINLTSQEEAAFAELCSLSIKTPTPKKKHRAKGLYKGLLNNGYTSVQIVEAFVKYIESYRATNSTPRFAKQLDDWLAKEDGAKFFLGKPRIKVTDGADADAAQKEELLKHDPQFISLRNHRFAYQQDLQIAKLSGVSNLDYYQNRFDEALAAEKKYLQEHSL